jgi:riboflavin synthase
MFTGIIEDLGVVTDLKPEKDNLLITIKSKIVPELKIDQSVAHNGVCLTVTNKKSDEYSITAIKETLRKTNLNSLQVGDEVNLERAMKLGDRLDGHIVQGHIDQVGWCKIIIKEKGSWIYKFEYDGATKNMTIEKGSITINGVSLTVVGSDINTFSVAIIPYTFEHTNFKSIKEGDIVNLEFDVLGKYIQKLYESRI